MAPEIPKLSVPKGAVAKVSIIDSTLRLSNIAASFLLKPPLRGFDTIPPIPTWCFLVESPATGRKALFDLGVSADWANRFAPPVVERIGALGWGIAVEEDVAGILRRHGVAPEGVGSVIWSHYHLDHIGSPATFPASTELVVGPGAKKVVFPGWPANPDSPVTEKEYEGRTVREINFDEQDHPLKIGDFRAIDFFGDGSFYLLHTPGHCIGHVAGLARTTSSGTDEPDNDTFILMGGDLVHHGGELRPSPYAPLPAQVQVQVPITAAPPAAGSPAPASPETKTVTVTAAQLRELAARMGRRPAGGTGDQPFLDPAFSADEAEARRTIWAAQVLDAQDNVFFVFAHDTDMLGVVETFPRAANAWREKGWRERTYWAFLRDIALAL